MKFYWFGDSWLVGDELELTVAYAERKQYVFAKLFSDHYSADCVNLGESGSSPDIIPWKFAKIVNQLDANDQVFFCLSASHRTAIFNEQGIPEQIIPGPNYNAHVHAESNLWYKYFDTPTQRLYNYDCTVNLLWLWCQSLGVKCWFVNLFTTEPLTMIDLVPKESWLLPRDQCISQLIMPLIDNQSGTVVDSDRPVITNSQWNEQSYYLDQYVKPGYCHPNVQGHQHIAKQLIKIYERLRVPTAGT